MQYPSVRAKMHVSVLYVASVCAAEVLIVFHEVRRAVEDNKSLALSHSCRVTCARSKCCTASGLLRVKVPKWCMDICGQGGVNPRIQEMGR
jgi:hypothetical protein